MKHIYEIRLSNLIALYEEFQRDTGGNKSQFAQILGFKPSYLSAVFKGEKKRIGDESARKIEQTFKREVNWLDNDHSFVEAQPEPMLPIVAEDRSVMLIPSGFRAVPIRGDLHGALLAMENIKADLHIFTGDPTAYALRVETNDLAPRMLIGEYLLIEPTVRTQPGQQALVILKDGSRRIVTLASIHGDEYIVSDILDASKRSIIARSDIQHMHHIGAIAQSSAVHARSKYHPSRFRTNPEVPPNEDDPKSSSGNQ